MPVQSLLLSREQFSESEQEVDSVGVVLEEGLATSHARASKLHFGEYSQQQTSRLQPSLAQSASASRSHIQQYAAVSTDVVHQHALQAETSPMQGHMQNSGLVMRSQDETSNLQLQSEVVDSTQSLLQSHLAEMLVASQHDIPTSGFSSLSPTHSLYENISFSTTTEKSQVATTSRSQTGFSHSLQSQSRISNKSSTSVQPRKQGVHTIVVQHSPIKQTEQSSLLNAVNKSLAGVELTFQSQIPKEWPEAPNKRVQSKSANKRQSDIYQHDHLPPQNFGSYVFDEGQEFSGSSFRHMDSRSSNNQISASNIPSSQVLGVRVSDLCHSAGLESSDSDLALPLTEPQNLLQSGMETATSIVRDSDAINSDSYTSTSGIDSQLHKNLMAEFQELSGTDSNYDHTYKSGEGRSSPSYYTVNTSGTHNKPEKQLRLTGSRSLSEMTLSMSPLSLSASPPPKHLRMEQPEPQTSLSGTRYNFPEMASESSTGETTPSESLSKDVLVTTTTLQDLAASELGASLPDSLATTHLISGHPASSVAPDSGVGNTRVMMLHPTENEPLLLSHSTQTSKSILKTPERQLHPLVDAAKRLSRNHSNTETLLQNQSNAEEGSHGSDQHLTKTPVDIELSYYPNKSPKISRKVYHCNTEGCGYETSYIKDLQRHKRKHTGERPFSCHHCGKNFNRSDKLRIHIRWHTGDKPFKCDQCDYASVDSSSLKKHIRTHTDERPFKCQICPYASRNSSQLIVHLRTHTGDSPFECKQCRAKFKINSDLKRHMRIHTGEKPYECDLCDYKCSVKGNLKSHYKINHSPENQLQCEKCTFTSSSQKLMREHLKEHTSGKKCPVCKYICSSSSSLRNHLRIHSDEKPYRCDLCPYSARQMGNVRSHMRKRHADKLRADKLRAEKIRAARLHSRSKNINSSRSGGATKKVLSLEIDWSPQVTTDELGRLVRTSCKKMHKCRLCEASFVRADSLRCHMRCHKDPHPTPILENQAVMENCTVVLQEPVSNQQDSFYKVSGSPAPQGFYIQVEAEVPKFSPPVQVSKSAHCLGSSEGRRKSRKPHKSRSVSFHGLNQIADAAARVYQEQYDMQSQALDINDHMTQHVQIVQVPVDVDSAQYASKAVIDNFSQNDKLGGADDGSASHEGIDPDAEGKAQVFVENLIVSGGQHIVTSQGSSYQTISIDPKFLQQSPTACSPYIVEMHSTPVSVSSPGGSVLTYVSSPVKSSPQSSQVTLIMSPPLESHTPQPASSSCYVTYISPTKSQVESLGQGAVVASLPQHSSQVIQLQSQGHESQQLQVLPEYSEKEIIMVGGSPGKAVPVSYTIGSPIKSLPFSYTKSLPVSYTIGSPGKSIPVSYTLSSPSTSQPVTFPLTSPSKSPVSYGLSSPNKTLPVSYTLTSVPVSQFSPLSSGIMSVAENSFQTVTSNSLQTMTSQLGRQAVLSHAKTITSKSGRPSRNVRHKYIKSGSRIAPAPIVSASVYQNSVSSLPLNVNMSSIMSLASSTLTPVISTNTMQTGGLSTLQSSNIIMSNKAQTSAPQSIQFQLQPHALQSQQMQQAQQQPQQIVLQPQQMIVQAPHQQNVQFQPSELPINLQVIHTDGGLQQQQQTTMQQSFPINIVTTPVSIQPQPPPPPPQPSQPTQIQIILPPNAFSPALGVGSGLGSASAQQIILQVQDSAPPPPPPPPPPQPVMQETPAALMIGNRLVTLPPNIMQMILSQLQNGMNVSLSEEGVDDQSIDLGDGSVQVQELVIQVEPQQVNLGPSALIFKKEQPDCSLSDLRF